MPTHVLPMEDHRTTDAWFTIGTWRPAGVPVALEARHAPSDDSTATVPSRLAARPVTGDMPPEWAADAARVSLHEWESYGLTISARALADGRLAVLWIDLAMHEDDGAASFRPSAAVLVAWDDATAQPSLAETWSGSGSIPSWLGEGLADQVAAAIDAGTLDEADRGIAWLGWVGEARAAPRLRTAWTRAQAAAERATHETSIRAAIDADRFDDAERELTELERDRSARALARTLRRSLDDAREAAREHHDALIASIVGAWIWSIRASRGGASWAFAWNPPGPRPSATVTRR